MTEVKIATRYCTDPEGIRRCFHYFLTVELECTARFSLEQYGVRITEESGSSAAFPALTTSPTRIDELITLLVDNRVGPATLEDVLEDWA